MVNPNEKHGGWWGLFCNGEVISVLFFRGTPSMFDFKTYLNSSNEYEVVPVKIIEEL